MMNLYCPYSFFYLSSTNNVIYVTFIVQRKCQSYRFNEGVNYII